VPGLKLELVPITLKEANAFVEQHHRHHKPARGCRFCVAVALGGQVVGVAITSRPVARALNDGWTAEVVRVATDGTKNACSMLYGASWRAARALGFRRLVTYSLDTEPGSSLRGAGWTCVAKTRGGSWNCPSRPRVDTHPLQQKLRWERRGAGRGMTENPSIAILERLGASP
jgi:hypothetical protein